MNVYIFNIINNYSYKKFNYGIKIKNNNINNDNIEVSKEYNDYIKKIYINGQINQNLKYHYDEIYDNTAIQPCYFEFKSKIIYHKTPLFVALSKNNFEIADMLIEMGANINYKNNKEDIIYSLYIEKLLNCDNLKYILNHGYNISKWWCTNDIKIYHWIKSFNNDYLDIYLNYSKLIKEKEVKSINKNDNIQNQLSQIIKEHYYIFSIYYENYNSIIILFNYDYTEKTENSNFYKLFIYFSYEKLKYKKFMDIINNDKLMIKKENINDNNSSDYNNLYKNSYINELKYKQLANNIYKSFTKFNVISKRSKNDITKQVINIVNNGNVEELKKLYKK